MVSEEKKIGMSFSQRQDEKEPGWMRKICRACRHNKYWHETEKSSFGDPGGWCATRYDPPLADVWNECGCKEFVPLDNLDYVEWLVQKKGLV